ncbi:hypothetical protein [Geotalea sp. SG265]|uniref:hypothetical protein n=1 Tax=Geotalea sp. SG265 TaxID=2922867 RepID=UPI001FAEC0AB|nr:hypothetical protein [Geotalea sp. SG265]
MRSMIQVLNYLFIPLSYLSFMMMSAYLKKKGIIKNRLYGIRIDTVFIEYARETTREKGYCGVWLWATILFFIAGVSLAFVTVFLM